MRQSSVALITAANMGANITSPGINLISIYAFSIQGVWSGGSSPVGVFKLQGSNDPGDGGGGQGTTQPINWTDITSSPQSITGNTGSVLYDVTECSYRWVRLSYSRTSGSATLTATMNCKGV